MWSRIERNVLVTSQAGVLRMNYISNRAILWGMLGFFCIGHAGQDNPFYDENGPFYEANVRHDRSDYRGAMDAYRALLDKEERCEMIDKGVTLEQLADAHLNYGQACWACGDFETGFAELNKYMGKTGNRPQLKNALVEQDVKNIERDKPTILVRATDGFGDTFTVLKFLKQLKAKGVRVVVIVQGPLQKLLSRSRECADVVITGRDPEPEEFDFDVHLIALGHFVSKHGLSGVKTADDIPRDVGYIHPQKQKVQFWAKLIASNGKRPLGICPDSSTNPVPGGRVLNRNVGYNNMAKLSAVKYACLYNLLSGMGRKPITQCEYDQLPPEEQKKQVNDVVTDEQMKAIYNFDPDTFDKDEPFGDTAAFMQAIKMHNGYIVSSDTSVPNLAGGVGADTCLLLDYHADARWGEVVPGACAKPNRFFECVKEFRQEKEGEWGPVMDNVIKYIDDH